MAFMMIKRALDVVLGLLALIILLPFMLMICFAIIIIDRQAPFFIQRRLTKGGLEFNLIKFQSMTSGSEEDYILTLDEDPRVTRVGRFLRRFRIDEIPQLINVIKGEMSLVGPRPERPHIAEMIEGDLPEFKERLRVKAGLTGYAQVYGTYTTPPEEKLAMDMFYIENWSLGLDFKLMIMTIGVIFKKESSKGAGNDDSK